MEGIGEPMRVNPDATPREIMGDFLGAYTIHLNGGELRTHSPEMQEIYDGYKRAVIDRFDAILESRISSLISALKAAEEALEEIVNPPESSVPANMNHFNWHIKLAEDALTSIKAAREMKS